jgi:chromosome segregation ATPase
MSEVITSIRRYRDYHGNNCQCTAARISAHGYHRDSRCAACKIFDDVLIEVARLEAEIAGLNIAVLKYAETVAELKADYKELNHELQRVLAMECCAEEIITLKAENAELKAACKTYRAGYKRIAKDRDTLKAENAALKAAHLLIRMDKFALLKENERLKAPVSDEEKCAASVANPKIDKYVCNVFDRIIATRAHPIKEAK